MNLSYLKTILYTISTAAILLCSSQNYAQQYYKWVDANGSTHYTTTPPPKGAKRLDKVSTYGNSPTTTTTHAQKDQEDAMPSASGHHATESQTPIPEVSAPSVPSAPAVKVQPKL